MYGLQDSWTVITVTYNSSQQLRAHWPDSDLPPGCWVVVDNGSQDDSIEIAVGLGARVVSNDVNLGFSRGNNLALAESSSEFVAFVNPDAAVSVNDLNSLAAHLRRYPGLCAPQLVGSDGSLQPNGRGLPTFWSKMTHRVFPGFGSYRMFAMRNAMLPVSWAMGAAVAGRRSDLESLGGWDDEFFIYYEDADLGLRAWDHGLPVSLCGRTRVHHEWDRATAQLSLWAWRHELRSALMFLRKHPTMILPLWAHRLISSRYLLYTRATSEFCDHG
jgi:N-acetylglucosaminyl-diphospho-decaprenol L-rhamnosyltransferase